MAVPESGGHTTPDPSVVPLLTQHSFFDALPVPALIRDPEGRLHANRCFHDRYGHAGEQTVPLLQILARTLARAESGTTHDVAASLGPDRPCDLLVRVGGPPWIATVQDATDRCPAARGWEPMAETLDATRRELQDAHDSLLRIERMASLGQLAAGMVQEVNGPVGVALTTASHLMSRAEDVRRQFSANALTRSALTGFLEVAREAGQLLTANTGRTAVLVHMFKQVAADQIADQIADGRRTFYLREYAESVLLSLRPQIDSSGQRVELTCPEALQLDSYPGAFARILTHLLRNALLHAFRPEQSGRIVIDIHADGEDWVELVHGDDGRGIATSDLPRIFDPFFTTARPAGCIGLGLHIARKLATQPLGGGLSVRSAPGCGAAFTLRVPRQAPAAP